MMAIEVVLPALGLTVEKGKILKWLKKEGETVAKGDSLYEVEADKDDRSGVPCFRSFEEDSDP